MNLTGRSPYDPPPRFVSATWRALASGQPCTLRLPGCQTGTTVMAHLRLYGWGAMAQKPHDFLAIHACRACHYRLDVQRDVDPEDVLRALGETLIRAYSAGLIVDK